MKDSATPKILPAPSPHFEARPLGAQIDTIVLHSTVLNSLTEVIAHFQKPESKVSSHYTIERDGTIAQHVQEVDRAWHAGVSQMQDGRMGVNDFSIGIELVNLNDGKDPYPQAQIEALVGLIKDIKLRFAIKHIVSHAEIAMPPGRKSDPLGFDFAELRRLLT